MTSTLRIATRNSPLALWQAEHVRDRLQGLHPGLEVELIGMKTRGDKILDTPLAKIGGKGLFVKELEQGMLEGRADIAVHSMKDVPVGFPEGLELAVIMAGEDPRDAFVSTRYGSIDELPQGAHLGTASLRRQAQLLARRPDLRIGALRGNVNTRLRKLDEGEYDAILLACAGLKRLGMGDRITRALSPEESLPAIGQGAIGIECRSGDETVLDLIRPLNDAATAVRVSAERALNETLSGGCQVPIGGHAVLDGDAIWLRGLVGRPDGSEIVRGEVRGPQAQAAALGAALGEELLQRGAREILAELYAESAQQAD